MKVFHRLLPVLALVDHQSVTLLIDPLILRYLSGLDEHVAEDSLVAFLGLLMICKYFGNASQILLELGDDEDMDCRLRGDILECQDMLVLVNRGGWYLLIENQVEHCGSGRAELGCEQSAQGNQPIHMIKIVNLYMCTITLIE